MVIRSFLAICLFALTPLPAHAATPVRLALLPEQSEIRFEAMQNGAPVEGRFGMFTADLTFHPEALAASKAEVTVDIASVVADYDEIADTLETAEWFDSARFPQAVFKTESFTALGDGRYEAGATLTIKDKSVPVTVRFILQEFNDEQARVQGETVLNRTDFGIGWEDTGTVADKVRVSFSITATPAE